MIGLAVTAIAIAVAGSAMSQYRSGVRQLITLQNLKAQASACLLSMRAGLAPVCEAPDTTFEILTHTPAPTSGAAGAPARAWVQVRVSQAGQTATLWGMVPQGTITATQEKGQ